MSKDNPKDTIAQFIDSGVGAGLQDGITSVALEARHIKIADRRGVDSLLLRLGLLWVWIQTNEVSQDNMLSKGSYGHG